MRRGLGRAAVDEFHGVVTGQALVGHQRVAIAEHVGTLGDATIAVGVAVSWLALHVVRARALARPGQLWSGEALHDATRRGQAEREAQHAEPRVEAMAVGHPTPPWRPAPPANRCAPAKPSASARMPSSSSWASARSSGRSCWRYALIRS